MIGDDVIEAVALVKVERSLRPVNHVRRQRDLAEDEWLFIEDNVPINAGRAPSELTALDQAYRERFLEEVRAICRARNLSGDEARVRIAKEIHPRYATFPSGKPFVLTSAEGIARKNHAGSVRKKSCR